MDIKDIISGDSPILDRFKNVAPGTNRHCVNVSLLCEAIGKEVKMNQEDLFVAARLHDIGKCNNPLYFSENQDENNIHDDLEPEISYQYISRHVSDGVLKLIQLGFSCDIAKIVSEHHGNTVLGAIASKDKKGDVDKYRYKSNKPSSKEACILMICDVIESATRSMADSGKLNDVKKVVDTLIEKLVSDEQLDIMKIGELRVIKDILVRETESVYHKRVDYEEQEEEI